MGINGLSLMPLTNVQETLDWGYLPMGYRGVDERFGQRSSFQAFVDRADQFHVDGFRYDCVPNDWDGTSGSGYAAFALRHLPADEGAPDGPRTRLWALPLWGHRGNWRPRASPWRPTGCRPR